MDNLEEIEGKSRKIKVIFASLFGILLFLIVFLFPKKDNKNNELIIKDDNDNDFSDLDDQIKKAEIEEKRIKLKELKENNARKSKQKRSPRTSKKSIDGKPPIEKPTDGKEEGKGKTKKDGDPTDEPIEPSDSDTE